MKIVQVIHGFPPRDMAGSEVYTYNLSKELSKRHEVFVFHRIADPEKEEYAAGWTEYDGLKVYTINNNFKNCSSFERTYRNDVIAEKFGAFLDEVRPDVVHFGHVTCLSTTCIEEAKSRNIPVVFTLHDFWLLCQRGQLIKRDLTLCHFPEETECVKCMAFQLDIAGGHKKIKEVFDRIKGDFLKKPSFVMNAIRKVHSLYVNHFFSGQTKALDQIRERTRHIKEMLDSVDLFIAPSRFLRKKYIDFGVPEDKIIYSDYGFDTTLIKGTEREPSEKIRFGYIGTWIPTKGLHVLIEAFNNVTDERAELKIYGKYLPYAGFPDYLERLKSMIRNPGIRLMGEYHNRDIGLILAGLDVLIVPSIWFENSPLTIHEAFLAGLPVITSDIGGMAEYVKDGVCGLNFKVGDSTDLYKKIKKVLDEPSFLESLRKNRPRVKTREENALEIEKIYDELQFVEMEGGYDFLSNIFNADTIGLHQKAIECAYPDYDHKELVNITEFTINGDNRKVLFAHPAISTKDPSTTIAFKGIEVSKGDVLRFGIAINPEAWDQPGDGVEFEVFVKEKGATKTFFTKYIDPKNNPSDRRWFDEEVDLSPLSGRTVDILFRTSAGPRGDVEYDWSGWSMPQIVNGTATRYDFIENLNQAFIISETREQAVSEDIFYLGDDVRQVVTIRPGARLVYKGIKVPEDARLKVGIGVPFRRKKAGVEIKVKGSNSEQTHLSKTIDLGRLRNRVWFDESIDLKTLCNQKVDFTFTNRSEHMIGLGPLEIRTDKKRRVRRQRVNHTNVLLITLDAVRADHLKCMGHEFIKTPNLDRFAREGVLFKKHFTQANVTVPSHLSILSSKYPTTMKVTDNYRYTLPPIDTLPQRLEKAGYTNSAVVSVEILNPDWCRGIEKGFHEYFPVTGNQRMGRQAKNILDKWIFDNRCKPFSAWIHLFDAHKPYLPPKPFYKLYYSGREQDKHNTSIQDIEGLPNIIGWLKNRGITDINFPVTQYAAEISYLDHVLGELFNDMERLGILDNTLVIITSDHGECLGEHDIYFDHQGLYDEVMHIPLIMRYPEALPAGKVVEGLTMNIDIMPTVLDILGMKTGDVEGRSLMPLIKNEAKEVHESVISENVHGGQAAIRTTKWKFIKSLKDMEYTSRFSIKKGNIELYDLDKDPGELKNVAADYPEVVKNFDKKLTLWLEERKTTSGAKKLDEDEETRKKLESLGYF